MKPRTRVTDVTAQITNEHVVEDSRLDYREAARWGRILGHADATDHADGATLERYVDFRASPLYAALGPKTRRTFDFAYDEAHRRRTLDLVAEA